MVRKICTSADVVIPEWHRHTGLETTPIPAQLAILALAEPAKGGGPNTSDPLTALEQWVEGGVAPEQIVASRVNSSVVVRTRPVRAAGKTTIDR